MKDDNNGRGSVMLGATVIVGVAAAVLLWIGYSGGEGQHVQGLKVAGKMIAETLPLLLLAFVAAGMVRTLIPEEAISRWVGEGSGIKGVFVGAFMGAITPGSPYVTLPVAAGLMRSGASVGTVVAYITGWSLWAFVRLPIEFGILGWRLTVIRLLSVLLLPPIAGVTALFLSKIIK